jgi:Histidine kinase-, DNA gyrase B-, and HSP90-like ATPase
MTKLERTTFEVSRASEYFDARQLSMLTGMPQAEFAGVCLKELVDNALDACETAEVAPEVGISVELAAGQGTIRLTVSDNGPGMPPEVVHKILDYSIRVSDKAAYRSPTRGAQGNALKTVIGIPYALGSREPLIISARGVRHSISPWVDPAGGVHFTHGATQEVTEGTTVSLAVPNGLAEIQRIMAINNGFDAAEDPPHQDFDPQHWCRSFAAFNPHATISYQAEGEGSEWSSSYKSPSDNVSYQLRAPLQKWPKFTNAPSKIPSRSTCPASPRARTGTVQTPSKGWSLTTSPTLGQAEGTCP